MGMRYIANRIGSGISFRIRIGSEILRYTVLIISLSILWGCTRSPMESDPGGVRLGEEPLIVFSFPGQKTSGIKISIWNHSPQPLEISTLQATPSFFTLTVPPMNLMPNESAECMATVYFSERFIIPEDRFNEETYELTGEMSPPAPYQGRAINFKLIRDKLFRVKPDESVKILVLDEAPPTVDLRLETYRVMDEIKLEQTKEILDITKSHLGREVILGLTPVEGLEPGTYTTQLLFSGLLAGEPTRRDNSISVMVFQSDPIEISPGDILLGKQPMGMFCQQKVIIYANSEDPLSLIDYSTTGDDTILEVLGVEEGKILIQVIQEIAGLNDQSREIQLKVGLRNEVFERKINISWYGQ